MTDERSPWRARVERDFPGDSVRAYVAGPGYLRVWEAGMQSVARSEGGAEELPPLANHEPFLRLREEEARALYEALAEHFGHNGHDTRALRRDYDAERARVDRLTTAMLTIAGEVAHRA